MSYTVVFADHPFGQLDVERAVLSSLDVRFVDGERTDEPLSSLVTGADAVMVTFAEIDATVIEHLEDCRIIARGGIGLDNVDVDAATERGIPVTNVPDYCVSEVATHTLALLLALERNVVGYAEHVAGGGWDAGVGGELRRLSERTLGLVGFGDVGAAVAARASAFDMAVLAHDPGVDDDRIEARGVTPAASIEQLAADADVLSIHAPLNPDTHHAVDADVLDALGDDGYLVNTARGGLVDERALRDALEAGILAGAALDVREEEPPVADDLLRTRDDLISTPHVAYRSRESVRELRTRNAENVRRALTGEPLEDVANPSVR